MYDVITVGSATIDVFADSDSELIKIKTLHGQEELIAYPVGTKILIKHIEFLTGGGGTNTAVAFKRLGLKTAYLGKLGDDENADLIIARLKKEKVEFIGVKGCTKSGYSIVLDSIEDDRTILTYKGCNDNLKYSEVNKKKLKTKWFYFAAMVGESYETMEKISDYAQKNNIKVAFNPSCYLAEKGKNFLKFILERTNVLVLNQEEAQIIVGNESIPDLLEELSALGPEIVVITDGKRGAYAYDGKKKYSLKAVKVVVKETTGAGDAFASAFVAALAKGKNVEFALKVGAVNAASCITNKGAKNILLHWQQALSLIKKYKVKVKKGI